MPVKVLDASAIGALVFAEPGAEDLAAQIEGASLIAPRLLAHELDNICVRKTKARPGEHARLLEARALADHMGITLLDVHHADVIRLAIETALTGYDAAYLWLAIEHRAALVTLDARLARSFARRERPTDY